MVGVGFIVPGLSGEFSLLCLGCGAADALPGEPWEKFVQNVLYFIPVGIGGVLGVVGFSAVVDFAFTNYAAQFTWLFIGFIAGTFPSLSDCR